MQEVYRETGIARQELEVTNVIIDLYDKESS